MFCLHHFEFLSVFTVFSCLQSLLKFFVSVYCLYLCLCKFLSVFTVLSCLQSLIKFLSVFTVFSCLQSLLIKFLSVFTGFSFLYLNFCQCLLCLVA